MISGLFKCVLDKIQLNVPEMLLSVSFLLFFFFLFYHSHCTILVFMLIRSFLHANIVLFEQMK